MRTRYRYDADLDAMVEIRAGSNYFVEDTPKGPSVVGDTMGSTVNGLRAMYRRDKKHFDSKSRYRADVKAHGLVEVGNEANFESREPRKDKYHYHHIVRDSWDKFDGNHNGMADRVRRDEQITKWKRENGQ